MHYVKLISSVILCELAGIIGALFTMPAIEGWYATLVKPSFSPPNWIFGPVWTTLYLLMGIALFLVWKKGLGEARVRFAFWFFIVHLVVNTVWSILFFNLHNILFAFVDIMILWAMIATLVVLFWRIDRWAAYLLIPYLVWVSFAGVLNYSLLILNTSSPQASSVSNVDDNHEYLSLPGSGIWFAYPKGWYESYYDPSSESHPVPKDAPTIINLLSYEVPVATSGQKPGTEVIGIAIFTKEIFEQYKKDNLLSYYFVPGFEKIYADSSGQTTWKSTNGFSVTEVAKPSYKALMDPGPSPTPPVLAGIFSVALKNGSVMIISSTYAMATLDETKASVDAHHDALYQKTKDLVQSISPL